MEMIFQIIFLLVVATVNSIDNMGVRIAYSVGGIKVLTLKNILISFMAFAVSFLSALSGDIISHFLDKDICSILSMLLLSFMGLKLILQPYSKKRKDAKSEREYAVGSEDGKALSYKEAISIGIALAVDDIGGSVSVGLVGYNPFMVGLAFFIVSYLIFFGGNYLIKYLSKLTMGNKTTIVSGLILIVLGISQVIE
jgi:putative Mn2+ efflux pump MntP